MPAPIIDLRTVAEMLTTALAEVEQLDGCDNFDNGVNSAEKRDVNQRLLALADGIALVSNLVRAEYWTGRGRAL